MPARPDQGLCTSLQGGCTCTPALFQVVEARIADMAGSSLAAHGLAGVDKGCGKMRPGEGEREGVLGLSAAASHSAEAVGGCRWFALSEGDLTARDHLGMPIASLPLLGPPWPPCSAPPGHAAIVYEQ
jgi:hypothetical protein